MHKPVFRASIFIIIFCFCFTLGLNAQDKLERLRELSAPFLQGWRFHLGEVEPRDIKIAPQAIIDVSKEWRFQTDPKNIGVGEKWFSVNYEDSKWSKIDAEKPWETQGYQDYDGYGWYRKRVEVPAGWRGKEIYLIFGGVDDEYDLYINGKFIAHYGDRLQGRTVHESVTRTMVSPHLKFGALNLICLRVNDWGGVGGARKPPVMLTYDRRVLWNLGEGHLLTDYDDSGWELVDVGHQWHKENAFAWYRKVIEIPENIGGFPTAEQPILFRVGIDDEGEIYVNGRLVQRFNWDRGKVMLTQRAKLGEKFTVVVKAINHGGPGRLLMACLQTPALDKVSQIIAALEGAQRWKQVDKEKAKQYEDIYQRALAKIDLNAYDRKEIARFINSVEEAIKLTKKIEPLAKRFVYHIIPQSHIDMAWLWRWPETVEVCCKETFSNVLDLMQKYPDLTFAQSQAAAYKAMEDNYPELFERIKKAVKEGRWEIVGGMWVEPDLNMPWGEALVRQLLYGKRYFEDKFSVDVKVGWNPDSFGHSWQLPQILKKSGIDYYMHYRCGKGPLYWWEAPDGSKVLVRTGGGDPLSFSEHYGVKDTMDLIGAGDHGGGPTDKDIENIHERGAEPTGPKVAFSLPSKFFQKVVKQTPKLPNFRDELNFEFEGCYTSQAQTKRNNRKAEQILITVEKFSTIASIFDLPYPKPQFLEDWRIALFNQFHDILDGSSIHPVYEDAQRDYDKLFKSERKILDRALKYIAAQIDTRPESEVGIPIIVFNPLAWTRTDVVEAEVAVPEEALALTLSDAKGNSVPVQVLEMSEKGKKKSLEIAFLAKEVPSVGYKVFFVHPSSSPHYPIVQSPPESTRPALENEFFTVEVDPKTGWLTSIYDKVNEKELLSAPGNLLQILEDKPETMSAWYLGLTGVKWELKEPETLSIKLGPVQTSLRISYKFLNSNFWQELVIYQGLPRMDIKLHVDWKERQKMLKVAFPTTIGAEKATFEIPYGTIQRPTDGHEAPAISFVDLSDGNYGLAILNDCKYGYDVNKNTIRLSLLRSPTDPDPIADEGTHEMTYSIYPHRGDWIKGEVLKRGWELNQPLIALQTSTHKGTLPKENSFFSVEGEAILSSLKQAEDSQDLILRLFEPYGKSTQVKVKLPALVKKAIETNFLENKMVKTSEGVHIVKDTLTITLKPYEIKTMKISLR